MLETISSGAALSRFEKMLVNQNVDPAVAKELCYGDVEKVLPRAKLSTEFTVSSAGDHSIRFPDYFILSCIELASMTFY